MALRKKEKQQSSNTSMSPSAGLPTEEIRYAAWQNHPKKSIQKNSYNILKHLFKKK